MRTVARLLFLLPLLWVEGVWAVDCPTGTTGWDSDACLLPPTISLDMTLTSGVDYLMEGRVTVGNGNGESVIHPKVLSRREPRILRRHPLSLWL